jgi:hypothetical protein
MAVSKAMKDNLQARQLAPDVQQRAFNNLGNILSNSIRDGVKSINSTKLVMNVTNVMSAATGFASRMQMNSEEELHALQQCVPITTSLHASGADVQQVLSQQRLGRSATATIVPESLFLHIFISKELVFSYRITYIAFRLHLHLIYFVI